MAASKPADDSRPAATIEGRAAELEAELGVAKAMLGMKVTIRGIKQRYPELFEGYKHELIAAIEEVPTEKKAWVVVPNAAVDTSEEKYGVEKLAAFFRSRDNQPATVQEMAKAIGRSDKTIKSILYSRHKGKFVTTDQRGRNNRAYFRMAEA